MSFKGKKIYFLAFLIYIINMKKILQFILKILSKIVLWKYNPEIVAVTGSVGKTSTKEAIYRVLKPHFNARRNLRNYNNEIGVPLTILDIETGGHSIKKWLINKMATPSANSD